MQCFFFFWFTAVHPAKLQLTQREAVLEQRSVSHVYTQTKKQQQHIHTQQQQQQKKKKKEIEKERKKNEEITLDAVTR